jgi:purine nucleosidase
MPLPIVLDTDIGTDIDDAYALVFAAASPELNLRAVTTVNNDTVLRAQIAREILRILGRADVPVAVGASSALTPGVDLGWLGHEGKGIDLGESPASSLDRRPAAKLIADEARRASAEGKPLTLLNIGAMTNAAIAFRDYPDDMAGIGRVIAMASCFHALGQENARGEHNVACDPGAFQAVVDSGVPLTLIGLNVTRETAMTAADLERIEALGGPLAAALAGMHHVWFNMIGRDHSPMHDALAVAAAFDDSLMRYESVHARIAGESAEAGAVEFNPPDEREVTTVRVAKAVDSNAFHRLFFARIESAIARCK